MEVIRAAQALFVLWIGAFAALVALNNVVDYGTNLRFVRHVFAMDTTFPGSRLRRRAIGAPPEAFHEAKGTAFAGLALGFAIWFGGFMVVGSQWFASWQSKEWNAREAAFMFYTPIALVFLILLHKT
jgi:predicted small integral membrane protein